ncbi:MAG: M48 family metallopeptidase [Desulfobacterales bacterium]|nr:M48 family metallopeptidase [Desulfobacterales bacterium]
MGSKIYTRRTYRFIYCSLCVLIISLFLTACAEVPITHRQSLQLLPESQLATLSLQEYDKVLKKSKLSTNRQQVQMVRRVGFKIAKAAEAFLSEAGMQSQIRNLKWEFNLIQDDKAANAWVMPGGKAAVYTGILPYTRNETGLAVVLGHEVAHAIAGHGNERMSQGLLAQMGGMALSAALSENSPQTRNLFMQTYGAGATVGLLLPYSRLHESEADRIGLTLMARAGYDPREAVPFWQRMNKKRGQRPPEFLSTHPAPRSRISNIKKYIPEALPYYSRTTRKTQ